MTVAAVLGAQFGAQLATAAVDATVPERYIEKHQKALDRMEHRITQADREAAAARAAAERAAAVEAGTERAAPVVPQGGVPDYFGSPNWAYSPALRKFVDPLPTIPAANPDTITYPGYDYYEIELDQYTQQLHSDLPPTTLRGYRQTNNGTDGTGANTIVPPAGFQYLGPTIVAQKDRPVRVKFTNNLATGEGGDLFLPVDPTMMGSGMTPNRIMTPVVTSVGTTVTITSPGPHNLVVGSLVMMHGFTPTEFDGVRRVTAVTSANSFEVELNSAPTVADPTTTGMVSEAFTQSRAAVHLHGGHTPWISDGTPHQWITPAGETTNYPEGVSVVDVPDMPAAEDGSQTFFYTNQQSARLLWYHDHAVGITRLNVYAGMAAPYVLRDNTEQELIDAGLIPSGAQEIPLVVQDKSFVDATTILDTDETWNSGSGTPVAGIRPPVTGDLWYPHVYSPAQNPDDLTGVNPYGRWHYGPWFWPPTTGIMYGPVPNPYYDPANITNYPSMMPGTPNLSAGGETWFDTAMVNGAAYPTLTVDPKAYRLRILNASNDRFWNLQLYQADSTQVSSDSRANTEIKMVPAVPIPGAPEGWPVDSREGGVPDPTTKGPDWIMIGSEGGFLPEPAIKPALPIDWITDVTMFTAGLVKQYSLLLAPAERADVVVDFSQYAGQTLILYNDAPAAFPAPDPRYDYYTGAPDMTDTGGYGVIPIGFSPNTRTIMQITVAGTPATADPPYDLAALQEAFTPTDPAVDGVFKKGQNPILVGQPAYNAAYDTLFDLVKPFWGFSNIFSTELNFKTVAGASLTIPMQPKAIQDEMGETFDPEYGRMMGNMGVELPFTSAQNQNFVLQGYIDKPTEIIDMEMEALAPVAADGTQIWKITHNGVDTHPVHFHEFDAQLINRVGWDGFITLPDPTELGWKDTIRVSPLEDTIVAVRANMPKIPFGVPDSIRPLNPSAPIGSTEGFSPTDPYTGLPLATPVTNELYNFKWEYVWHCHILSHEEMDMMRPIQINVSTLLPGAPVLSGWGVPDGPITLSWVDPTPASAPSTLGNLSNEIGFRIMRAPVSGAGVIGAYAEIGTALANATTYTDTTTVAGEKYSYRVVAYNAAGSRNSNAVPIPASAGQPFVTNPNAGGAFTQQSTIPVTWTVPTPVDSGSFVVYLKTATGSNILLTTQSAVAAETDYTFDWNITQPGGTGYRILVWYRNAAGSFLYYDLSDTRFDIVVPQPTVTAPNAGGSFLRQSSIPVTWTIPASVDAGSFVVYLKTSTGSNYLLTTQSAVAGQTSYTYNWNITQPVGTGYRILVWYRNAGGSFLYYDFSDASFEIVAPQPTVTNPNAGGAFTQGDNPQVTWTIPAPVNAGSFVVYLKTSTGSNYLLTTQSAVAGQTSYTYSWTITQPAATGYRILVWYRNAGGSFLYYDLSDVPFDILAGP